METSAPHKPTRDAIVEFFADVREVLEPVTDRLHRIWKFWGPRLTDRGFVAGVLMNLSMAGMVSVAPETLNLIGLLIWVGANFVFPTWDALPAGEKIAPRVKPDAVSPARFDVLEGGSDH